MLSDSQIGTRIAAFAIAFVLALPLLFGSWFTIDQGERGVHLRNGRIVGVADPGFGFKLPFFDKVKKISVQNKAQLYTKVDAYSKDQQPAMLRVSVSYHVPVGQVVELYSEYGTIDTMVARLLDRQVPTQVENVFGQYTAISAVQKRPKLVIDVTAALRDTVNGPIIIDSVQIENIDFSDAYEGSIEARMKAEVAVETQKQTLEREKISAQIAITTAKGQADSKLALARANAETIRILGIASATAIKAKQDALSANGALVELTKAEKWNGQLPTTMVPDSTIPFLNVQ